MKSELTDKAQVLISVSDSGVGLPEGKEDDIFGAFFTTKPQGTGMGLAIASLWNRTVGGIMGDWEYQSRRYVTLNYRQIFGAGMSSHSFS